MARLTTKQNKFIDGVVGGLSQSEAYRQAGYKTDSMTNKTLAEEACKLASNPNVSPIIAQRKKELADKAIWSREEALNMLRGIALDSRKNVVETIMTNSGDTYDKFNSQAQSVAIKAIEQANKMCGYNEPARQDITLNGVIKVELTD